MRISAVGGGRLPLMGIGVEQQTFDWFGVTPVRGSGAQAAAQRSNSAVQSAGSSGDAERLLTRLRSLVAEAQSLGLGPVPATASFSLPEAFRAGQTFSIPHSTTRTEVTGVNREQVAGAQFGRLSAGERIKVEGEVTRRAEAATLTIRSGAGGIATAGGTYQLAGNGGSATLAVVQGEALSVLGARINEQTAVTGVEAELVGDDLVLSSIDRGGSAFVDLQPLAVEYQTNVAGVNAGQIGRFDVDSFAAGEPETLSGRLESAAQAAELVYHGAGGSVAGTASFRLTGQRGEVEISIINGESLAAAAERINEATAATGVVATVDGEDLRLTSDHVGASARVEISAIERAHNTVVSGVNASQIADVQVVSINTGSQHVLSGTVTRSASAAELALQGSAGGTVLDTATFELRGSLGETTIDITEGETLAAVADRVNAQAESTGVVAAVVGDELRFSSSDVGSSARVEVDLVHVAHTTSVSGVNSQQLTSFGVNSFTEGASQTLTGSVTQTATQAQLTFTGNFLSLVGSNATIRVNGSLGSVQLSVTSFQSVSSLANQVNQHTQTTGVSATVQGNKVHFRSTGAGSAAVVDIDVLSGTFNVTGGNGQGTATGTNAVAVINGQTIIGAGNQFLFSDVLGSYSFTSTSGFTGALSPVSIVSQAGSFEVSGGNGDGTASGLDGLATINGVELTGVRNQFAVSQPGGEFELEFAGGFTGQSDPVTVASIPEPFDVSGGDGAGSSSGSDARAVINGVEYTSADGRFAVEGEQGSYTIEFAAGFAGDFDSITVASTPRLLEIDGGDGEWRDTGEDAEAIINGVARTGDGSTFRFAMGGREVTLAFLPEFAAEFDTIEALGVQSTTFEVVRQPASAVRRAGQPTNGTPVVSPFEAAVSELNGLIAEAGGRPADSNSFEQDESQAATQEQATRASIVREQFDVFSRLQPQLTANPWELQAVGNVQQIRNLVDLLA